MQKLSEQEGQVYRLPSEAEWEYAARAGSSGKWCFGDDERQLKDYAWYAANAGERTHPVGQLKPNGWGVYGMHGNVWEWCQDGKLTYTSANVTDPFGPTTSGSDRVYRGGSRFGSARDCRSAYRRYDAPVNRIGGLGFRLLRTIEK